MPRPTAGEDLRASPRDAADAGPDGRPSTSAGGPAGSSRSSAAAADDAGSGRRELADWLTDPAEPADGPRDGQPHLAAPFRPGLVATPNDFGTRGQPPTHPELLDWLAARFVADGWSHQGAAPADHALARLPALGASDPRDRRAIDPENVCSGALRPPPARRRGDPRRDARRQRRRSTASPGGPHPFPPVSDLGLHPAQPVPGRLRDQPPQRLPDDRSDSRGTRSSPSSTAPTRTPAPTAATLTTVPTQALFFLNDPFVHEQSARSPARCCDDGVGRRCRPHRPGLPTRPRPARHVRTETERRPGAVPGRRTARAETP